MFEITCLENCDQNRIHHSTSQFCVAMIIGMVVAMLVPTFLVASTTLADFGFGLDSAKTGEDHVEDQQCDTGHTMTFLTIVGTRSGG
jgi:hypothetical protein